MEDREDLRKNNLFTPGSFGNHLFPYGVNLMKRYNKITVKGQDPASSLNKTILLTQNYFNQQYQDQMPGDQDENELQYLRSRLDRVNIDDQEYKFAYYNGWNGLPNKQTRGVDHFGFYNGNDQNVALLNPFVTGGLPAGCSISTVYSLSYSQQSARLVNFNFGQAGLLKQVRYPTRGTSVFEYEPHTYVADQTTMLHEANGSGPIVAGGARIKSIKEYDFDNTLLRWRHYSYTTNGADDLASSSGVLMTPLMNLGKQPLFIFNDPSYTNRDQCGWILEPNTSIPGNNAAEGKIIGYSSVNEFVEGTNEKYRNSYFFENNPNAVLGIPIASDGFPNINGQTKEVHNYNSSGFLTNLTVNSNYNNPQGVVTAFAYRQYDPSIPYLNFYQFYNINKTFTTPFTIVTTTADTPSGMTDANVATYAGAMSVQQDFQFKNFLLSKEIITGSSGETIVHEYKRPLDYTGTSAAPSFARSYMIGPNVNMIEPVIEEMRYKNGVVIEASANRYELQSGKVNLTANYAYNRSNGSFTPSTDGFTFGSPYELKTTFSLYDAARSKLQEYTSQDGVTHSFIWAYKDRLPVAHGVGISFSALNAAYAAATAQGVTDYEGTLRSQVAAAGGQVTTYQHKPLFGVSKVIDPSGLKLTYTYDNYGRLDRVIDNENHIVNQNIYHFKSLPITRTMALSATNINFGSFTTCNMPGPATLTISNTGEADLLVSSLSVPTGFYTVWNGGTIFPGTSVDVQVFFAGSPGTTYNSTITINSPNMTTGSVNQANLSATYNTTGTARTMQLSATTLTFPISYSFQNVTITNSGNDCFQIDGVSWTHTQDWQATITPVNLAPGQQTTLSIMRINPNAQPDDIIIKSSNFNGGTNAVHVSLPTTTIGLSYTNYTFPSFSASTATYSLVVSNSGGTTLNVTVTSSNSQFTSSLPSFSIPPNSQQTVTITFTPTDFSAQSGTLTFTSDVGGYAPLTLAGQRTATYTLSLSPASVTVSTHLQTAYSYIQNTGNVNVTISSVTQTSPSAFTVSYQTSLGAAINFPYAIKPGEQITVTVKYVSTGHSSDQSTLTYFTDFGGPYTLSLLSTTP
jgi:YD repeat-containing protein